MPLRYLDANQVTLPSRAPLFVEEGHCQWCKSELTGRQRLYCSEKCTFALYHYWCSRPAYVRATFIRDNFTCQECGYHKMMDDRPWLPDMSNLECDHIIPLARVRITEMDNLQTLCRKCNRQKGIKVADEPAQELPWIGKTVVPSKDKTICPSCRARGYQVLPWQPPEYYDPLMFKVKCSNCGEDSYIVPKLPRRILSASRR